MAAPLLKYGIGNSASTTASAGITGADTTVSLTATTNFQAKAGAGMILMNEGTATEELAYSTGLAGSALAIPLANRGLEGGSAQAQTGNFSIKGILTVGMWNDLVDSLTNVLNATTGALDTTKVADLATAQTFTNKVLTATSNNVNAKGLHSATTVVDVVSAAAPSSGKVLTATSSTAATWQTPASATPTTVVGFNQTVSSATITNTLTKIATVTIVTAVTSSVYLTAGCDVRCTVAGKEYRIFLRRDSVTKVSGPYQTLDVGNTSKRASNHASFAESGLAAGTYAYELWAQNTIDTTSMDVGDVYISVMAVG